MPLPWFRRKKKEEQAPETANAAFVLIIGGNVFLPVRQLADVCALELRCDKDAAFASLVPDPTRVARPRPEPAGPTAVPAPAGQAIRRCRCSLSLRNCRRCTLVCS